MKKLLLLYLVLSCLYSCKSLDFEKAHYGNGEYFLDTAYTYRDSLKIEEALLSISERKLKHDRFEYQLIEKINVVDVRNKKILKKQWVLLHNDTIVYIGRNKKKLNALILSGSKVLTIKGRKKYLAPGLCNMHVHYCGLEDRLSLLKEGVTTIRNVTPGPTFRMERELFNRGLLIGPDLINVIGFPKLDSSTIASADYKHQRFKGFNMQHLSLKEDTSGVHLPSSREMYYPVGLATYSKEHIYSSHPDTTWLVSRYRGGVQPELYLEYPLLLGTENHMPWDGFHLLEEMDAVQEYTKCDNGKIIQMATMTPGEVFKDIFPLPFGLIEQDYVANMVILTENPLEKVSNYKNISSVFIRGIYIQIGEFSKWEELIKE